MLACVVYVVRDPGSSIQSSPPQSFRSTFCNDWRVHMSKTFHLVWCMLWHGEPDLATDSCVATSTVLQKGSAEAAVQHLYLQQ